MGGFYSDEYKALLTAQKALTLALEPKANEQGAVLYPEPRDSAQVTRALVDLVRLKRDMRGVPDPKPVDVSQTKRKRKPDSGWIDPSAQPPGPAQ